MAQHSLTSTVPASDDTVEHCKYEYNIETSIHTFLYDYILAAPAPPTLLKLKTMKGADGKPLKIVQSIAAHDYTTFGMCLLQDENGEVVTLLKKNHIHNGAEGVTEAILQKWLTSDAPTRTYQHLIECLRQSELGALAELIANSTGTNTYTYKL